MYTPCSQIDRNKKTLCSSRVPNQIDLKYAFCPYLQNKCFQKPIIFAKSTQSQLVATTEEFRKDDYCVWKFNPTDTDLYFSRKLNLTVNLVLDVSCTIYHGENLD